MGKKYKISGYDVEEVSLSETEQVLKIAGQKVVLKVEDAGRGMRRIELDMPGASEDRADQLLSFVYEVMRMRVYVYKDASNIERAALWQLQYNEALRAENEAKGLNPDRRIVTPVVRGRNLTLCKDMNRFTWLNNPQSKEYKCFEKIKKNRRMEYLDGGSIYDSLAFDSRQQRFEEGVDARNEEDTNQGNMLRLYSSRNNGNDMA